MSNPPEIPSDTISVFVGHSDDADLEAKAVCALETRLLRITDELCLFAERAGGKPRFRRIKFWEWRRDIRGGGVGGQKNIEAVLNRADIGVFIFKERVGEITWQELDRCRTRRIPIIALFPARPPASVKKDVVCAFAELCEKRQSLTENWTDPDSQPIAPLEYTDCDHLAEIASEQIARVLPILVSPLPIDPPPPPPPPLKIIGVNFQNFRDPSKFKNRENELRRLQDHLANPEARFIYIVGPTGIGKTALLARFCEFVEHDRCLSTPSALQGLVYFDFHSGANAQTAERLFHDLSELLDDYSADQLTRYWGDLGLSDEEKFDRLLARLQKGLILLAIDNFEHALAPNRMIADERLRTFLQACLTKPHALRVVATSRRALPVLHAIEPRAVFPIQLDRGLPTSEAIAFLRDLDIKGNLGLRDALDSDLAVAATRCSGRPIALRAIATTLALDSALDLSSLLDDRSRFEDRIVENPLPAHYEQLPNDVRRVLEALAVYDEPVPAPAVEMILAPVFPRIEVVDLLEDLADSHFISASREHGTYVLDAAARDFAYGKIPRPDTSAAASGGGPTSGHVAEVKSNIRAFNTVAYHRRAAEYYAARRPPREAWTSFEHVHDLLSEIHHLLRGHLFREAAHLVDLIDAEYLQEWGQYQTAMAMREQLGANLTDKDDEHLVGSNYGNLAKIYRRLGRTENVEDHFTQAIEYANRATETAEEEGNKARMDANRAQLSLWHCERGNFYADQVEITKAVEDYNHAVAIARAIDRLPPKVRPGESLKERSPGSLAMEVRALGNLAITRRQLGYLDEALELYGWAIKGDEHLNDRRRLAVHTGNSGKAFLALGDVQEAIKRFEAELTFDRQQGARYSEGTILHHLGEALVALGRFEEAVKSFRESIDMLGSVGESRSSSYALESLGGIYQLQGERGKAREAYERCRDLQQPETAYRALVMLGVLSLEEGDAVRASEYLREGIQACATILAKAPRFYEASYRLAVAYAASDQCDKAMNEYRTALSACDAKGVRDDALRDVCILQRAAPSIPCLGEIERLLSAPSGRP